jgi:tetratricopeptide (TPR) repeat protein
MTDTQENLNQERKEEIKNSIANEPMQSYDINEVRNEVARLEKEVDSHDLINYLKEFLRTHNPKFNHLISLFKVLIRSMKKTKEYEVQEIIKYIDDQLERYPEKDNTESYCSIADIYKRLGKVIAVSYLEGKLGDSMSDNDKTIDHINPMLLLSGYYLSAAKDREKAINTIQRAILLFSEKTNNIEYKRLFPLIEGLLPYMKEIKEYDDREIIKFIDKHSRKYSEYDDVKSISKIANLYFVVGKQYGIEYLEDKLVGAKTLIYFDLTIQLSDYYQ